MGQNGGGGGEDSAEIEQYIRNIFKFSVTSMIFFQFIF